MAGRTTTIKPKARVVPHPRAKQLGIPAYVAIPRFVTTEEIKAIIMMKDTCPKMAWEECVQTVIANGEAHEMTKRGEKWPED